MVREGLLWCLETPIDKIAIKQTDSFLSNSIRLSLEHLLVKHKSRCLKHILHLVVIHGKSSDIPELGRNLKLNSNVIEHSQCLVNGVAITAA